MTIKHATLLILIFHLSIQVRADFISFFTDWSFFSFSSDDEVERVRLDMTQYQVILESPGINSELLHVTESSLKQDWKHVKASDASFKGKVDLQLLIDQNRAAQIIWSKWSECYGNDYSRLVRDYFLKNVKCDSKADSIMLKELGVLHSNVQSSIDSLPLSVIDTFDPELRIPPLHPLLGQIMVELYAYYKAVLTNYIGHGFFILADGSTARVDAFICTVKLESATEADRSESDWNETLRRCKKIIRLNANYSRVKQILFAAREHCSSFGLLPNTTLFIFSRHAIFLRNGHGGYSSHPANKPFKPHYKLIGNEMVNVNKRKFHTSGCWRGRNWYMNHVKNLPTAYSRTLSQENYNRRILVYTLLYANLYLDYSYQETVD